MPSVFFSTNSKLTGCAVFVSFNSKEEALFMRLVKQTSWNAATKKGSFKDGATINVKFSPDEIGDLMRAVRTNSEAKFYHSFQNNVTSGSFRYYEVPVKEGSGVKNGFGLVVKNGDVEYKAGFSLASAERLMEYLRFALDHMFSAIYAADKKSYEESVAAKKAEKVPVPTVLPKAKPESVPAGVDESGGADGDLF